jgi:hypothetical protein
MGYMQDGYVYEASGVFYVRYCNTTIVDGQPKRVQRSQRLHEKGGRYYTKNKKLSPELKQLRDEFMVTINKERKIDASKALQHDMTIAAFWETRYVPYCQDIVAITGRPRKKPSTVRGYTQIWRQHLKSHFGSITLQRYDPYAGTAFLQSLADTQGRNTLKHIKAVASSIFKRAVTEQRIK